MKGTGWAALLLGAVLLTGCSGQSTQTTAAGTHANAETTAREVLTELYSAGAQDSADFEEALARSATGESALDDYLIGRVGDKLSDEGMNAVLDNRVLSRVFNAWPSTEVAAQDIDLDEQDGTGDTNRRYAYTVTAGPEGEDPQQFTGVIALSLTDGVWQVTGIE
ncbi:hypothetical protein [Subdoligranulum variabile]|uniref:DUF4878 domain-containing protein n=1 Tax=Subdoligranulum variabile DSM 15176 TaxID=411471 RepID=D1PRC0_9FIRM|nr:hypothetical protein [Subdoligranulum variabile]EFB74763.1 hypothetical protein SUBVAR_06949 [Subdoligranulum variabile DSM 15176]UWP69668.1 hypothetical protein NQ490_07415 [Subdoligranulum variabile]